ncbi:hypothetical protein E8E13_007904 [Curvularia kusanoi]|uniref:Uncharacterized protein n=1 Tax=Curvularia kusanoi TaxID=90978 RepID=A0A9P4WB41_CURKU|nr:hypothetical protein E8E13_007904 [Curvularia kusanoi]
MAKISELDEQRSLHFYESDSDLPDPVELWDDEDEDGPLLEKDDNPNCFRTMPNPELVPGLLRDAARVVLWVNHIGKIQHSYLMDDS